MGSKPGLRLLHRNMMMSTSNNQRNNVFESGTQILSYRGHSRTKTDFNKIIIPSIEEDPDIRSGN